MIYNLNYHKFIKCEECRILWGYEEKDLRIATNKGYNIFDDTDFIKIEKYFICPRCGIEVVVSKDEKIK